MRRQVDLSVFWVFCELTAVLLNVSDRDTAAVNPDHEVHRYRNRHLQEVYLIIKGQPTVTQNLDRGVPQMMEQDDSIPQDYRLVKYPV